MNQDAELFKSLKNEIDECNWELLKEHHERRAVVIVERPVDLVDVGVCLAMDNSELLKDWMGKNLVYNAEDSHTLQWKEEPKKKQFNFLIIQPYVLIQLKES